MEPLGCSSLATVSETVTVNQVVLQTGNSSELEESTEIVASSDFCEESPVDPLSKFIVLDETSSNEETREEGAVNEDAVTCTRSQSSSELGSVKDVTESSSCTVTQVVAKDDLFIVDSQPGLTDADEGRRSLGPRYRRDYDGVLTTEVVDPDEGTSSVTCPKGEGRCFNCLGDHVLNDCPKPRDNAAIYRNRRTFFQNQPKLIRYHTDESTKFGTFKPGVLSNKLQKALGLERDQLPTHIYRMRLLGYPPGWLEELKIHSSGISLLGTNCEEKGSTELKTQFDAESVIEYPGFNVPPPPNTRDEAYYLGYPPMMREHSKEAMFHYLTHLNSQQPTHKRFADDDYDGYPKKKMKFEETTETDNEEVDMELSSNASLDELETQRLALLAQLEDIEDSPEVLDNQAEEPEPPGAVGSTGDGSPATPVTSKVVELGTPVGIRFSPYGSVPSLDRFAQGMAEIPLEEVVPVGIFEKVKNVLKRVKQTVSRKS